jgi:hypothetical protein
VHPERPVDAHADQEHDERPFEARGQALAADRR